MGYVASSADPCLYIRKENDIDGRTNIVTAIGVYVDDLLIKVHPDYAHDVVEQLKSTFTMTYSGEVTTFLGLNIKRDSETRAITVDQHRYLTDKLTEFGHLETNGRRRWTPASPGIQYTKSMCMSVAEHTDEEKKTVRNFEYRSKIGALLYIALRTRPDIANAVRMAARFCADPGIEHCRLVDNIFQYLSSTREYSLTFGDVDPFLKKKYCLNSTDDLVLNIYADADLNKTGYSATGIMMMLNGGWIFPKSKTQTCVALSTMEAELVASCTAAQRAQPIRWILSDLGYPRTPDNTILWTDAQANKAFIENPKRNQRNAHIERKYLYVCDLYKQKAFDLRYVNTKDNIADIGTKSPTVQDFVNVCKRLFRQAGKIGYDRWNFDKSTYFGREHEKPAEDADGK